MTHPLPLFRSAPATTLAAVDRLFFDVDDTLTWKGQLPLQAIDAIHRAQAMGISLVAVTGRSLAWAEMLLRLFPLDAAIGETGAACLYWSHRQSDDDNNDAGPEKTIAVLHSEPDEQTRALNRRRREEASAKVMKEVQRARLALDNMGRVYDTAFDLVEDGPPLNETEASRIREILREDGLVVAQSSVHINAWFGTFDKASMVDRYLREVCETSLEDAAATLVYAGDSKNDGPMFAKTPLSVGVKNVAPYLDALKALQQAPAFIVSKNGGAGFAEIVEDLVAARSKS